MTLRKAAGLLLALGLTLGLLGAGVSASFTDSAHADMAISVGTFDITLTSALGQVSADGDTVTYAAPTIARSDADSALFTFTVHNGGTMAAAIHVSATAVPTPFHDYLVSHPVADFSLPAGAAARSRPALPGPSSAWPTSATPSRSPTRSSLRRSAARIRTEPTGRAACPPRRLPMRGSAQVVTDATTRSFEAGQPGVTVRVPVMPSESWPASLQAKV